jgi:hypothetical protein
MLALGRTTGQVPGGNVGLISRYVIIASLITCALLTLIVLHRPQWPLWRVITVAVMLGLTTHALGGAKADNVHRAYTPLTLAATALRIDAPAVLDTLHIQRDAAPAARALGAYPFNGTFTLGCHGPELGQHLNTSAAPELPTPTAAGPTHGTITSAPSRDALITGWATINGAPPDCILITDPTGTIIGGGITALPSTAAPGAPDGTAWQAVAPPGTSPINVFALQNGSLYSLKPIH